MTEPTPTPYQELKRDVLVISHDGISTKDQQRSELVERLKFGITRSVIGEPLVFKLIAERPLGNTILEQLVVQDSEKRRVAVLSANIVGQEVHGFEKYYEHVENRKLRGIGIITFASALFFQVLICKGVLQVHGLVRSSNRSSIASRLKTEDLINGGYFYTVVSNWQYTKNYHEVVSYVDPKLARLPEPISLADAQLNQIFFEF